jgi:hypothetical protein
MTKEPSFFTVGRLLWAMLVLFCFIDKVFLLLEMKINYR